MPPINRVHEQVFQLDGADGPGPGGEVGNRAILLRDMSAAIGQAFWPQDQVFRMSKQAGAIACIRQRRTTVDTAAAARSADVPSRIIPLVAASGSSRSG